jgi:integrase
MVRASYGDVPLFPEIAPDRDGTRSSKIGRKIRDMINDLGIEATPYSFRHRFISQLKTICPDPDYRRYIAGHKPKDVHADTYLHYEPWELKPFLDEIQPAGRGMRHNSSGLR